MLLNKNVDKNYIAPIATNPEQNFSQKSGDQYNKFFEKRSYPKFKGKTDHWAALAGHVTDCNDRLNKLEKMSKVIDIEKVKKGLQIQMCQNEHTKSAKKQKELDFEKRMIVQDNEKFKSEKNDKVKKIAT